MIRGGGSTTSLATARHQGRATEEQEEEVEVETTTSTSTTSPSTLMTSSKTLTTSVTKSRTSTTFTPRTKLTRRDTLTATSRPTGRPWTGRGGRLSRGASGEGSLTTCLRTWRRCSPLTRTTHGLRAGFRAQEQGGSTAGQWLSAGGTWWPPSLTAPETLTQLLGHCWV